LSASTGQATAPPHDGDGRAFGEEDAAPIRFENLSEYQLEMLIKRLERG
jgi:hypothetical protein